VPGKIVVVEDEPTIASAVAARLRADGHEVLVAADGLEGVALCRRERPDLVVLDLMLPGLDGYEVCRQVQAERPVPVLVLTARGEETDVVVGLRMGADDYVVKPFSLRELSARVDALLRRASRRPDDRAPLRAGEVELDPVTRRVARSGQPCT
jgi:DNA-binding response OmpR family regulator